MRSIDKFGFVLATKMVFEKSNNVGYFYHESPDRPEDSGWRFFSGNETQEYVDCPDNIGLYDIKTILENTPGIADYLQFEGDIAFERADHDAFHEVPFEPEEM
ncbi:MAG: DUF2185 domain-containing protein [Solobacterium sp.]|nr:DUF2185 domain-containing protein [Solobacterium sp.]